MADDAMTLEEWRETVMKAGPGAVVLIPEELRDTWQQAFTWFGADRAVAVDIYPSDFTVDA